LIKKEAIKIISKEIGNAPIISANGFISRDLYQNNEKNNNFYMIGSMGLASSIGLGVALKNPKKKIHVFDGDGNILMNLGSLITIGSVQPKNFIHYVFDNKIHESTGGQPTNSKKIDIEKIAKVAKFKVFRVKSVEELKKRLKNIKNQDGPIMMLIEIKKGGVIGSRIKITPPNIKDRFMTSIE
jgi:thiamine pyrophosphate-dependent acetolactate synthase large subunit-like protein